ncbi:MAG TPA: YkgJ family cysteine cluster protein [Caldilineaceae bacterium]|nr:YkgJ family cysteine cluster protein [Caldilineaceae bacterium]
MSTKQSRLANPCLSCGACCTYFRASFHWSEADDAGGTVPIELTVDIDQHRRAMVGTTDKRNCRCVALGGIVGFSVRCEIYEVRSSACRDFPASWITGEHNPRCDEARAARNLPPLTPDDWGSDEPDLPLAA